MLLPESRYTESGSRSLILPTSNTPPPMVGVNSLVTFNTSKTLAGKF